MSGSTIENIYDNRFNSMDKIENASLYEANPIEDRMSSILEKIKLSKGTLDIYDETSIIINNAHQYGIEEMQRNLEINEYYCSLYESSELSLYYLIKLLEKDSKQYPEIKEIKYNSLFIKLVQKTETFLKFCQFFPNLGK